MSDKTDSVELCLPFKAEYVSIARLVTSGVCSKINFDIDTIEDIKVAVSEVCNKIVSEGSKVSEHYKVKYNVTKQKLAVIFSCDDCALRDTFCDVEELGVYIINALMDNVELSDKKDFMLTMEKVHEGNN